MPENEIEICHLTKSFESIRVLDDISLTVHKGDIYGILGLSGAGKSTLVRCINGLEKFDEGKIFFKGELLCSPEKKIERNKRNKISMIFQSFNLLQQKTVLKNVMLALSINGQKDKSLCQRLAMESLKKVGLEEKANSYPSQLSGGQQQRVAIARALVLSPEVILCDEATSALDPETTKSILQLLKKLNQELGLTIIMISHQMNVIEEICNKVAIINSAKIIEQGELSDVFLNPRNEISRSLIYSNHLSTVLEEHRLIRILFDGNIDQPLISNIVQDCQIMVSIVYADTKVSDNRMYGQTIIKRPKDEKEVVKLKKYLAIKGVRFEEVEK
ncbi:MAG: methionine ABC transporter ATP-binding protein [Bacilli bacterium]